MGDHAVLPPLFHVCLGFINVAMLVKSDNQDWLLLKVVSVFTAVSHLQCSCGLSRQDTTSNFDWVSRMAVMNVAKYTAAGHALSGKLKLRWIKTWTSFKGNNGKTLTDKTIDLYWLNIHDPIFIPVVYIIYAFIFVL